MRVVKLTRSAKGGFVQALHRLGCVPAAPRDRRIVEDLKIPTRHQHLFRETGAPVCNRLSRLERPKPTICRRSGVSVFRARCEISGLSLVTRDTQDFPEVPVLNPFEDYFRQRRRQRFQAGIKTP